MMQPAFQSVCIFGVGLIGGSFGLALRRAGAVRQLAGVGRSAAALASAQRLGIIDVAAQTPQQIAQAVRAAELILIAAPVAQTASILATILPHLQPGTIVTDAGSTKSDVVAAARAVLGERVAQFVPAHPIAGREQNGPEAALADLYAGKKTVITRLPENRDEDVARVEWAWRQCGALVHYLEPAGHDSVFAAVSHLPHLLAYALVDEVAGKPHADTLFQYAASGFRDFTRIAGSSPEMWRDISLANRSAILSELDAYTGKLAAIRSALAAVDGAALEQIYHHAQEARQNWIATIEAAEKQAREGGD